MKLSLVVFDLAGTTVKDNNDVAKILQHVLHINDVQVSLEEALEVMGIPKATAIRQLLLKNYRGPQEVSTEWVNEIHQDFIERMVGFYQQSPSVEEKEGASVVFALLREKGLRVYVNTGFDRKITDALLERLGWVENNLIDGSVTSDEVDNGRPFPDLIYKAMELAGVSDTQSVAKVGDTLSDLMEGLNAGCKYVIGVTSGAHSESKLQQHYHTHLVHNLHEIIPILTSDEEIVIPHH